MPSLQRVPKQSLAFAWLVYRMWLRLPPSQRRQLVLAMQKHGPRIASKAAATATESARKRVARR
jgi:hypothetical protein